MRRIIKNKKFFFFLILGAFLIIFFEVSAYNEDRGLELDWPNSPITNIVLYQNIRLEYLVKYFYEWGIALGGLAAFIALLIAGFQYLTSAGNVKAMQEAREKIVSAFLGLLILFGSYLILNTINPQLTTFNLPTNPFGSGGELDCDTVADCGCTAETCAYECTDPCPNGCVATDTTVSDCVDTTTPCKEGVCVKTREGKKKECAYAVVKFGTGATTTLTPGVVVEVNSEPESVTAFCTLTDERGNTTTVSACTKEAEKEGYHGCGCYLYLYAGKKWYEFWKKCGDLDAVVYGCEQNIDNYTDKEIRCLKLTTGL